MKDHDRLPDDLLDQVSGGTNSEMSDLQNRLGAKNIKEIIKGLRKYGISAELSSESYNLYTDIGTGKELSHDEVLRIIR